MDGIDDDIEMREFRASCRRFAEEVIAPTVDVAENTGVFPRTVLEQAGEAGFLGLSYPESDGGSGAPISYQCIAIEEFARICAGITAPLMGLGLNVLSEAGSVEQRIRYLRPALEGKKMAALALTEPDAGSDVLSMRGEACRTKNGWRLKTNKMYITGAPVCDFLIVIAYTDRSARARGLSAFVVERQWSGVEVLLLEKVGHRSIETGAVYIDAELPRESLIGEEGSGLPYVGAFLNKGRVLHAARSLGVARAAYEDALAYAKQRLAFGKSIVENQSIEFKLARMLIELTSARMLIKAACDSIDHNSENMTMLASMAKLAASETAVHVSNDAMQILGGAGYMMDSPVQRYWRDARLYPVSEGTSEIQLKTIAKQAGIAGSNRDRGNPRI